VSHTSPQVLSRAKATTRKIEDPSDILNFDSLRKEDQRELIGLIEGFQSMIALPTQSCLKKTRAGERTDARQSSNLRVRAAEEAAVLVNRQRRRRTPQPLRPPHPAEVCGLII
jgi:hypothetical protein